MKAFSVVPRVLADDMLVSARGSNHGQLFQQAFHTIHEYLDMIGARVASSKNYTFSTDENVRSQLRDHIWPMLNSTICVVNHIRDLGTHFNVNDRKACTTLTDRLNAAIRLCEKLHYTRLPYYFKQQVVKVLILPTALYGCEASFVCLCHSG